MFILFFTANVASKPAACKVEEMGPMRGYLMIERAVVAFVLRLVGR